MHPFATRETPRDFHLFRRDRKTLHAGIVVVLTLLGLATVALTLPRSGAVVTWASALVIELLA